MNIFHILVISIFLVSGKCENKEKASNSSEDASFVSEPKSDVGIIISHPRDTPLTDDSTRENKRCVHNEQYTTSPLRDDEVLKNDDTTLNKIYFKSLGHKLWPTQYGGTSDEVGEAYGDKYYPSKLDYEEIISSCNGSLEGLREALREESPESGKSYPDEEDEDPGIPNKNVEARVGNHGSIPLKVIDEDRSLDGPPLKITETWQETLGSRNASHNGTYYDIPRHLMMCLPKKTNDTWTSSEEGFKEESGRTRQEPESEPGGRDRSETMEEPGSRNFKGIPGGPNDLRPRFGPHRRPSFRLKEDSERFLTSATVSAEPSLPEKFFSGNFEENLEKFRSLIKSKEKKMKTQYMPPPDYVRGGQSAAEDGDTYHESRIKELRNKASRNNPVRSKGKYEGEETTSTASDDDLTLDKIYSKNLKHKMWLDERDMARKAGFLESGVTTVGYDLTDLVYLTAFRPLLNPMWFIEKEMRLRPFDRMYLKARDYPEKIKPGDPFGEPWVDPFSLFTILGKDSLSNESRTD